MDFKPKAFLLLCITFLLQGCSQTMIESYLFLQDDASSETVEFVEGVMQAIAAENDFTCRLRFEDRRSYFCKGESIATSLAFGFRTETRNSYVIVVDTTVAHTFPPKAKNVEAGKFVPEIHSTLETAIATNISPTITKSRKRRYIGYDFEQPF